MHLFSKNPCNCLSACLSCPVPPIQAHPASALMLPSPLGPSNGSSCISHQEKGTVVPVPVRRRWSRIWSHGVCVCVSGIDAFFFDCPAKDDGGVVCVEASRYKLRYSVRSGLTFLVRPSERANARATGSYPPMERYLEPRWWNGDAQRYPT